MSAEPQGLGPAPPGSPVSVVLSRNDYSPNYFPAGTVFGRGVVRWVKVGSGLRRVCPVCFAPVDRRIYCRGHRPERRRRGPTGEFMGETRAEQDRRIRKALLRAVAFVQESPRATSHQIRLAFPFQDVSECIIAEARRLVGVPRGPKFKPHGVPFLQTAAQEAATA